MPFTDILFKESRRGGILETPLGSPPAAGSPAAPSIYTMVESLYAGVNITRVNGITVDGSGTLADPWGPV